MPDPTIPEIVARLRELHAKLQALQVGTPEFTAARQLFRDALQLSAPGILDALERFTAPPPDLTPDTTNPLHRDGLDHLVNGLIRDAEAAGHWDALSKGRAIRWALADERRSLTWRPISEPPSAEEHAWCGGRYLMRHDDGELLSEHWDREFPWDAWASGYREYLPIPPSDERRG